MYALNKPVATFYVRFQLISSYILFSYNKHRSYF